MLLFLTESFTTKYSCNIYDQTVCIISFLGKYGTVLEKMTQWSRLTGILETYTNTMDQQFIGCFTNYKTFFKYF